MIGALGDLLRAAGGRLADQELLDPVEGVGLDDAQLVVEVEAVALQLVVDDLLGALVAHDAFTGEDLHVDDRAVGALVDAKRRVLHVGSLLAEDRAEQLLFRRQRRLALRRDLAHERIARVHFRADVDDARLVETSQLVLRQVRDVAGDFLGAELGVARHDHQLLDVDRGVAVFGDHALADEDRVFEVVAVPRHERDQHVLAEGQLADVGGGTVGDDVFGLDHIAALDDRALVDVGVLVRALVLDQVVDVDADFARDRFLVVDADDDAVGIDVIDDAAALGGHHGARVFRGDAFDAGAHEGLFRAQRRHGLALHVGAHQRAVRIVVLEERHQRGGHRDDLRRRHVHVLDALGRGEHRLAVVARRDQLVDELAVGIQRGARLRDHVLAFFDGRQVVDLVAHLAVGDPTVRRLEEAVFVQLRVEGQRVDQADVRAFRRLDRADPAVVRRVHVADFEAGALTGQAARARGPRRDACA